MKVYIISDYRTWNPVRQALDSISSKLDLTIVQPDLLDVSEELVHQIVESIKTSDIVIADISNEKPVVYYEIGLAHALGKPVIIVTQIDNFDSFSLISYRYFKYDINPSGIKQLSFYLEQMLKDKKAIEELKPLTQQKKILPFKPAVANNKLQDILLLNGRDQATAFERWIFSLLIDIPGFEVEQSSTVENREYDLVVWNGNEDSDAALLGNPIPIELKTFSKIDNATINYLHTKAHLQGFKSLVILTTAKKEASTYSYLQMLKNGKTMPLILLDRSELENVNTSRDLYNSIIVSLRQFLI